LNISQHKEAAHYRGAKIAINISHFNYDQYSSDRLVRILGTGTMCLSKYFINAEKRFEDGKHLRFWNTFEELENLIKYYLENEEERKHIAKRGCWLAHREYTFENLALNIKKLYEKH
jgi:spore maturation protein CgeB